MRAVFADERGRITLGSKTVDEYGRKFAVVRTPKEIVLVPIADDPLAELQRLGRQAGIDSYTLKELRQMAREGAEKEAGKHVR
ncbi:AbrB/MazE/SpoVT family DNA-binding domain-containing protein [Candidatus Woesearchaeota archaeon]|nr:AbrB/MazE/SpoVT family DNA-binding domain-containing protein [Candidatus Woesearchaeota archaeon]